MKKKTPEPTRMVILGSLGTERAISYEKGSCSGCKASNKGQECLVGTPSTRKTYLDKADPNCLTTMIVKDNPDISINAISKMISAIIAIAHEARVNNMNIKMLIGGKEVVI